MDIFIIWPLFQLLTLFWDAHLSFLLWRWLSSRCPISWWWPTVASSPSISSQGESFFPIQKLHPLHQIDVIPLRRLSYVVSSKLPAYASVFTPYSFNGLRMPLWLRQRWNFPHLSMRCLIPWPLTRHSCVLSPVVRLASDLFFSLLHRREEK